MDSKDSRTSRVELICKCSRKPTSKAKTADPDKKRNMKSASVRFTYFQFLFVDMATPFGF